MTDCVGRCTAGSLCSTDNFLDEVTCECNALGQASTVVDKDNG